MSLDPADDYLIALARASDADFIVSRDTDLSDHVDRQPAILMPAELLAALHATP